MTSVLIEPPRDCDACGRPMAPSGGICRRCGQRLCGRHLYGTWQFWRRLPFVERICEGCRESRR